MNFDTFKEQFNISLNEQQSDAVKAADGAVLLLAVPGSGKTTVLVTRLGYMIYCLGIAPEKILTMTYTVAATADMKKRFVSFFGDEYASRLEFRTINGVCARVISYYEYITGRKAFDLMTDEGEIASLLRGIYHKVTGNFAVEGDVKSIRSLITYAKNMMLSDGEIKELDADFSHFSDIYNEYCSAMLEKKLMDYDDQMVYAYRILKKYPDVLSHFRGVYEYICVDEAQDTSKIQHMIIRLLVGEKHNIFMVGDEDQSIYGFRAAYPEALMEFSRVYPDAKVLMLETNYRSTVNIVEKAGSFIKRNKHRHEKNMKASHGEGKPVCIVEADNRVSQYEKILSLVNDAKSEIAILYRDNDSAIPLIDLFDRRNIKYRSRGVDSTFFTNPVVRDILDIISFATDETDSNAFLSVYYKFGQGISKEIATEAAEIARQEQISPLRAMEKYLDLPKWLEFNIRELIYNIDMLSREKAFNALRRIVYYMGYRGYLDSRNADTSRLDILFALAKQLDKLVDLPVRLTELEKIIKDGASRNADVILSTIHSSKGLEYEKVLLIDVVDGLFPKTEMSDYSPEDEMAMEEERRLFYVGITRAKKELLLMKYTETGQGSGFVSHFISETKTSKYIPKKQSADISLFTKGATVVHKKFGTGIIKEVRNSVAIITFDKGEAKFIDLIVAVKNELLKLK